VCAGEQRNEDVGEMTKKKTLNENITRVRVNWKPNAF